jgi:hypothetical protein
MSRLVRTVVSFQEGSRCRAQTVERSAARAGPGHTAPEPGNIDYFSSAPQGRSHDVEASMDQGIVAMGQVRRKQGEHG